MHPLAPLTLAPQTFVAVFLEESHARVWQRGLNAQLRLTSSAPIREYLDVDAWRPKGVKIYPLSIRPRFSWMAHVDYDGDVDEVVAVQETTMEDLKQVLDGRDIKCRVYVDPMDTCAVLNIIPEVTGVRARLEQDFSQQI